MLPVALRPQKRQAELEMAIEGRGELGSFCEERDGAMLEDGDEEKN